MTLLVSDLRAIAASGGGMILDASKLMVSDLRSIAASANSGGGQVTLRNVSQILVSDLRAIAASGGGRIVFDFLS